VRVNGKEKAVSEMSQWELVRMHDLSLMAGDIGLSAEECRQRSNDILNTLAARPEFEEHTISPLIDREGIVYDLTPREWAETLGRRAAAMSGVAYAGEMPSLSRAQEQPVVEPQEVQT